MVEETKDDGADEDDSFAEHKMQDFGAIPALTRARN